MPWWAVRGRRWACPATPFFVYIRTENRQLGLKISGFNVCQEPVRIGTEWYMAQKGMSSFKTNTTYYITISSNKFGLSHTASRGEMKKKEEKDGEKR